MAENKEPVVASIQKIGCGGDCEIITAHIVKLVGDNPLENCLAVKCKVCGHERNIFAFKDEVIAEKIIAFWDSKTVSSSSFPILKDGLLRRISIEVVKRGHDGVELKVELS